MYFSKWLLFLLEAAQTQDSEFQFSSSDYNLTICCVHVTCVRMCVYVCECVHMHFMVYWKYTMHWKKFYLKPLKSFSQIVIISSIFQIIQTKVQKGLCMAKTIYLANSRVEIQTQIWLTSEPMPLRINLATVGKHFNTGLCADSHGNWGADTVNFNICM